MSNIQYGLISKTDAATLEKTIDLIWQDFMSEIYWDGDINTCCIGIFDGDTDRGIYEYITTRDWIAPNSLGHDVCRLKCNHTSIDNNKDKDVLKPFPECNLIIGNSNEVYNQLPDNSQHLIFVDANHSFPSVIQDWFCYAPKVKVGGYMCLHDTAPQAQGKDWQRIGSKDDLDMYISTRKALKAIGFKGFNDKHFTGWECIFDEYDPNDDCGGVTVFKKLY